MTTQIRSIHFDADQKLLEHVNKKIEKLKTFHVHIIETEVFLKLDNVAHHIKDKVVEIKVHIPKHTLFIKEESKTFEESCEAAFDAMFQQLKKAKEQAIS